MEAGMSEYAADADNTSSEYFCESDVDSDTGSNEIDDDINLVEDLRCWALSFNIRHIAVKELLKIQNRRLSNTLPQDPRTLLKTTQTISLIPVGDGHYWHHGFKSCIEKVFSEIKEPVNISIKINMDGLPVYKSSKDEFWPILFNIDEFPYIKPMVIGIYSGKHKPTDLTAFLDPFVNEMIDVCKNGIMINGFIITVSIRCFVCDSPARAFIKGVANFNAQNGCQKCVSRGEYSHVSHTNFYPQSSCPTRTDEGFRNKDYGSHHKSDSPLLRLPIDMIKDFPVGDSLHLIDLGIMKKLLLGWRDGSVGSYRTKWPASISTDISKKLLQLRMPLEIHRSMRGLDCLSHWKGSEFRTFLHYASIVILKPVLPPHVYEHFLVFFCAITICSSDMYSSMLELAHQLLTHFVDMFKSIYGEDYVTSNFHNLMHLIEDVKRFGPLHKFNAYPFESKLFEIKISFELAVNH
ncbi:uncharacterized protein LOC134203263 [Armigeres subalbatus]|uniref:uncharacterized protein LOC134203263 n=1 Tax=Armigeres subalbatus TaxID=124917 RepID=UPI002ED48122